MTSEESYSDDIWSSRQWEPPVDYNDVSSRRQFNHLHLPSSTMRDHADSDEHGDDMEGNPKSFRRVCQRFAERTSMQGIPYVYVSRAIHARLIWVLIFLTRCGFMSGHLYLLISEYYEYETQTQVDLGFSPLNFPAVTVCNINRIRKSKLDLASTELRDLIADIQPSNIVDSMESHRVKNTLGALGPGEPGSDSQPPPPPPAENESDAPERGVPRDQSQATGDPSGAKESSSDPQGSNDSSSPPGDSAQTTAGSSGSQTGSSSVKPVPPTSTNPPTGEDDGGVTSGSSTATPSGNGKSQPLSMTQGMMPDSTAAAAPSQTSESSGGSGLGSNNTTPASKQTPPSGGLSGSSSGSGSDSQSSSSPRGRGRRRKRRSTLSEALEKSLSRVKRSSRVKRFIEGFDVNETSSRFQPNSAEKALNLYSTDKTVLRKIEDELKHLYSIQPRPDRVEMGHQIEDMLLSCSFAGYECVADDFKLFQTAEYGNCYSIESSTFISVDGGPSDGLELMLYLDSSNYVEGVTNSKAGVQVLVHEPGTWPLPWRRGFAVPAAMETYVGLRQVNLARASQPYGSCQTRDPDLEQADIKYTRTACQIMCKQRAIYDTCGCYDATSEELNLRTINETSLQFCVNSTEIDCLTQIESDFLTGTLSCSCENACSEKDYTRTQTSRGWPSTDFAAVLAENLCSWNASACESFQTADPQTFSENFVKLVIYFEDLNYEDISEKPDYADTQFISDVGGTIGLWIGLSVISFFEVLQFFYEVGHYFLVVKPKQRKKSAGKVKDRQRRAEESTTVTSDSTKSSTLSSGFPPNGPLKRNHVGFSRNGYLTKI